MLNISILKRFQHSFTRFFSLLYFFGQIHSSFLLFGNLFHALKMRFRKLFYNSFLFILWTSRRILSLVFFLLLHLFFIDAQRGSYGSSALIEKTRVFLNAFHLLSNIVFSILFCSVGVIKSIIYFVLQCDILNDKFVHIFT